MAKVKWMAVGEKNPEISDLWRAFFRAGPPRANRATSFEAPTITRPKGLSTQQEPEHCPMQTTMASLEDIMEACGSVIFSCLTVKETVLAAGCSKEWRTHSRDEIAARAEVWVKETSRAWACKTVSKWEEADSADDLPDNKRSLGVLDEVWRNQFSSPSHLLETIADWCGGWPRLLHARETSARSQPKLIRGRNIEFTTLGNDPNEGPFALIFDIHCDGKHKWSGVLPVNSYDIGSTSVEDDDGEDLSITCVYPFSSKTIGDLTDNSTYFSFEHGNRPPRYLLSTDADDTRTWRFNVSIVSPKCFETLILSVDGLVPREIIEYINELHHDVMEDLDEDEDEEGGYWEPNSGCRLEKWRNDFEEEVREGRYTGIHGETYIAFQRRLIEAFVPDEKLLRCSYLDPITRLTASSREAAPIGIEEDGKTKAYERAHELNFSACYWLDKRNPEKERMHLILEFNAEDSLWSDMILNTRKDNLVRTGTNIASSSEQERPAKRSRTSSS